MEYIKTGTIITYLTDYLKTSQQIQLDYKNRKNKPLLQDAPDLSPDLQGKVGNTGSPPVTLTRQYNQREESGESNFAICL